MSDLADRLRERGMEVSVRRAELYAQAADRIDALEECLRECLKKGARWHPCDPVVVKARALLEAHD